MKTILSILIASLALAAGSHAEIYKWRDSDGMLHFSDRPTARNAEETAVFDSDGGRAPQHAQRVIPKRSASTKSSAEKGKGSSRGQIKAKEYDISAQARQQGDEVVFTGRVGRGPKCERLTVHLFARSRDGQYICETSCLIEDAGGFGSKVFKGIDQTKAPWGTKWSISNIYTSCN